MSSVDQILPDIELPSVLPESMDALTDLLREWQSAFDVRVEAIKRECQREFHEKLVEYIEQGKLARHRQFGPSSESANLQSRLFNEVKQ